MKRLTWREDPNYARRMNCRDCLNSENCKDIFDCRLYAVNRLATIEDILDDDYDLDHLRKLVEADREGKYAALPCKLGEILWCINSYGEVEETVAVGFLIEKESVCIYYKEKMSSEYYNAPIGKVLFLTREAAEKALEGENP